MTTPQPPRAVEPPGRSALTDLVETLSKSLSTESKGIKDQLQSYEESRQRERRAWLLILSFLVAAIVVAMGLIFAVRQGVSLVKDVAYQVQSCTTPEGECAKRQQEQVSDFRTKLIGSFAIVTDCDVSTDNLQVFRKCVKDRTGLDSSTTVNKLLAEADKAAAAAKAKAAATTPAPTAG